MPARTVTHNGVTLTIKEWAKRTDQSYNNLRYRLEAGWPIEQALFQPLRNSGRESFVPTRMEQERKRRAVKLEREFSKLLFAVDNALRSFREQLDTLLPTQQTGGWVEQPEKAPSDRTTPAAQDSV